MTDIDALLLDDHPARAVWDYVDRLDLEPLRAQVRAVGSTPGRPAIDPRILMTLWLYATLEGVGSARALARLCTEHHAFQWICGGVKVNYHTLSDFRVGHGEFLDELLTRSVAALLASDLVQMQRVAQDGVRVRASVGAASFRRKPKLEELHAQARTQVERLKQEVAEDPGAGARRIRSARLRAAQEREERIARALDQMHSLEEAQRRKQEARAKKAAKKAAECPAPEGNAGSTQGTARTKKRKGALRVSTTDAEVRVMKMGDGGYRPAVNVQAVTDVASQVIVAVDVCNSGSDLGQLVPMVEQLERRYARLPREVLADGGFRKHQDIEELGQRGVKTYMPVLKPSDLRDRDLHAPRAGDTPHVGDWRTRMGSAEAQKIYRQRAASAECVNAHMRNRGLRLLRVRGLDKIRSVVLWHVLAHNLQRLWRLTAAASPAPA